MSTRKAAPVPNPTTPEPTPEPVPVVYPTLGAPVYYRLTVEDGKDINRRRKRSGEAPGNEWGFQAHRGTRAASGQIFPATVVRVFDQDGEPRAALQVALDGTDTLWVESAVNGTDDGQWSVQS